MIFGVFLVRGDFMMNYIWGFMLIAGIVVSLATGRADAFTDSFLASCTDAVEFTLSLAGVMAVWSGLMKIAEESGLIDHAAKALRPILTFLFPKEKDSQTIAMRICSTDEVSASHFALFEQPSTSATI